MKLTIGMSNRNRDWFLDRSIYLLSKQTLSQDEWELIIVDDGSTDKSEDVILRYKKMNIIKNFHYIKNTKKRCDLPGSPARTNNIAAKVGSGDYILYTDPEIMPLPDWVEHHHSMHEGRTDTYVCGRCLHPREFHIVSGDGVEYCRGALLGNAYTDYDWYNIENVWKIMNEKIQKIHADIERNVVTLSDVQQQHAEKHSLSREDMIRGIVNGEFFNWYQGGISLSRKLMFELGGFEEDFCDKSLGLDIYGGLDVLFNGYLVRSNVTIILPGGQERLIGERSAKAIHIYHPQDSRGGAGYDYAYKYLREHPDQRRSNINREWGLVEENGFIKVF